MPALTIVWHPHLDRIGHIAPLTNLLELDVAHVSRSEPIFFPPGADAGEPLSHRFISKDPSSTSSSPKAPSSCAGSKVTRSRSTASPSMEPGAFAR